MADVGKISSVLSDQHGVDVAEVVSMISSYIISCVAFCVLMTSVSLFGSAD